MVVGLLCLALCACDEKPAATPEKRPNGAACRSSPQCESGGCADQVCVEVPRKAGESCGKHARCADGLVCHESTQSERKSYRDTGYDPSMTYGDLCRDPADVPEIEAERQRAAERKMLESSGLSEEEIANKMAVAEAPGTASAGPGLPVRVVRTQTRIGNARGTVIAACRDTERLISGSCGIERNSNVIRSRIDDPDVGVTGYSEVDTVGASWTCVGRRGDTVVVKALCQALPPAGLPPAGR